MGSTPGHHQSVRLIGDVLVVQRGRGGAIQGVILKVQVTERMTIAILSNQWPDDVTEGTRLDVRGQLRNEQVAHKRATHYFEADHIAVVPRRRIETH
jgi:uncharacterized protein YndB with AHSA1/START domain